MSLADQERVLLELLFDAGLRARFAQDRGATLASRGLSEQERIDFEAIDGFGLEQDARMRAELLLARLARAFPLSFSICSSREGGLAALRALVDVEHVLTPAVVRTARYGERVSDALVRLRFADAREQALCAAIVNAEVAFAATQATLRQSVLRGEAQAERPAPIREGWPRCPLSFAPALCVVVLPRSYAELTKLLCPCAPDELWARLARAPLPAGRLTDVLATERPRVVVSRAVATRASRCDATITQQWLELSQGFLPLLRHVDGTTNAETLLTQLGRAGAKQELLDGVRGGLRQLLEQGMLRAGDAPV